MRLPLQLINGLSDEKVRWQETVENLEHMLDNISGNVLVAAGFVAYLGPFTVRNPHPYMGQPSLPKRSCLEASPLQGQPAEQLFPHSLIQ